MFQSAPDQAGRNRTEKVTPFPCAIISLKGEVSTREFSMNAIRQIFDDAAEQLRIDLPPELRHRRVEVIILPLDEPVAPRNETAGPRYRTFRVDERLILDRDALHER